MTLRTVNFVRPALINYLHVLLFKEVEERVRSGSPAWVAPISFKIIGDDFKASRVLIAELLVEGECSSESA